MLVQLHRAIEHRSSQIASAHGNWPCRKGCDGCCRQLAAIPSLTLAEWELLEQGLAQLCEPQRQQIAGRIQDLRENRGDPRICPFLDRDAGSCLVYQFRPVACRTYGYYVERERGLYCREIEQREASGEMAGVVWGNASAVETQLGTLGEKMGLLDWFSGSPQWSLPLLPTPSSTSPCPSAGH